MPSKGFNWFNKVLTFILSFIPGCGHMYIGLMKRGVFILFSFFACCYLAVSVFYRVFTIGFIIIWFFSFFDAYNCRKKLESGKEVIDDVDDIKGFLIKHRRIIVAVFGIIAVVEITRSGITINNSDIIDVISKENKGRMIVEDILIFCLISIGLYSLFFRKK